MCFYVYTLSYLNRVSELKVHIELTRFVQPEKIEIDANERAVNEKSQYCFFVCTTFDSFLNDLVEIAKTHGKTAAQIALRYLMQSGVIVIPKSVHTERIKENFELFDFALTAGEMERLANMDTATPMIGNPENPAMVEAAMKW